MNSRFQRQMKRATTLARKGDALGSTRAVQSAFGRPARKAAPRPQAARKGWQSVMKDAKKRFSAGPASTILSPREAVATRTSRAAPAAPQARTRPFTRSPGTIVRGLHTTRFGAREWRLYVPSAATRAASTGKRLPLVVMLHGCTQDSDDFAAGTRMDIVAEAAGCFVLYPEQGRQANPQRCWNWFKHTHQNAARGEPAIIESLLVELLGSRPIDRGRIYAAGLSAGGAMAAILGATSPALFAAVGVHSGLPAGAATDLGSAMAAMQGRFSRTAAGVAATVASGVPTIVFHGDRDTTVHPVNGEQIVAAAVAAATDFDPASALRLERTAIRRVNGRDCERVLHRGADDRILVESWLVRGMGHVWSGGDAAGTYTDAAGPDASREMLRFFMSHGTRP